MKRKKILLALSLPFLFVFGCQLFESESDGQSVRERLLLLVGAATYVSPGQGGVIKAPTMSLTVPQGALDAPTTITHSDATVPAQKGSVVPLQAAYKFGPAKLQFNKPATLKICYDAKDVAARGLTEKTMQIQYVDPTTGNYVSMGGDVDYANHCVSAPIYHFSTYVLTAQILELSDNAPTIGGASFFPGTPIENLPVTVRTSITDWDPGSAVASVRFYYRTAGSGAAFTSLAMTPEANDGGAGRFYKAVIPATDVVAAGFEYYIEAHDTLNKSRTRPVGAPGVFDTRVGDLRDPSTPIRFQSTVTMMTAGFSRDLAVQVKGQSAGTWFPVRADTIGFGGAPAKGETTRPTWLNARYTAQLMGTSSLNATYGNLPHSVPITIFPGVLNRIEVLHNDVVLPTQPVPFEVNGFSVTQLDAAGYDAYGNFTFVLPVFTATPAIGTFGSGPTYGHFTAANVLPNVSGTITASIGGYSISHDVLVHGTAVVACVFDTDTFDSGACGFGP